MAFQEPLYWPSIVKKRERNYKTSEAKRLMDTRKSKIKKNLTKYPRTKVKPENKNENENNRTSLRWSEVV